MKKVEFQKLLEALRELGVEVDVDPEEIEAYLPSPKASVLDFYIPRPSKDFYFNPEIFRKLLGL